ncbi:hypothetical protein AB0K00_46220 [Dactylosporangium sp. NPDC049525]|uniref:hypothetical protein n=1 Tax=Dactylosporangium sp. NPDC049525 TaxID=3154730 RepID=UPI00341D1DFC
MHDRARAHRNASARAISASIPPSVSLPEPVPLGNSAWLRCLGTVVDESIENFPATDPEREDRLDDEATSRHVRDRYLDFARHYYTANAQPASANR